jgi:hypothetical protein
MNHKNFLRIATLFKIKMSRAAWLFLLVEGLIIEDIPIYKSELYRIL